MSSTRGAVERKELMIHVYASVLTPHSATYCSAPITSGERYFEWLARIGRASTDLDGLDGKDREAHTTEVVQPNRHHLKQVVAEVRRFKTHVIDPGAVPSVPEWTQSDWLDFWEEVIALFANEVVFVDGWEYSYGSAHEFWFAHNRSLPTFDERMRPLTLSYGTELIQKAYTVIRSRGASAVRMEGILKALAALERGRATGVGPERRPPRSKE